ncbi:MAG: enoyl-CoA hydratase [Pseudomonadales bacterium]|nr:enoyl-CoA hydratase [Pseudomonadales bacterium]
MTSDLVLCARDGSVAEVTLNRPEVMNALSFDLRAELTATFRNLASDHSCEIVILTGAGRAFTAGLDLKELGGETSSGNNTTDTSVIDLSDAVGLLKVPLIGAINGFAITGGFELALMCDILIASTKARFADTHARVGVVPGWGLSQRLPRLVGINRAKELSLSGNFLDAQTAYNWGLVNRVVDPDDLLPSARALAQDILSTDRPTREAMLNIMDRGWNTTLADGLDVEAVANESHAAKHVKSEKIAARRQEILRRGRSQA